LVELVQPPECIVNGLRRVAFVNQALTPGLPIELKRTLLIQCVCLGV
jgi:hypothetical protein